MLIAFSTSSGVAGVCFFAKSSTALLTILLANCSTPGSLDIAGGTGVLGALVEEELLLSPLGGVEELLLSPLGGVAPVEGGGALSGIAPVVGGALGGIALVSEEELGAKLVGLATKAPEPDPILVLATLLPLRLGMLGGIFCIFPKVSVTALLNDDIFRAAFTGILIAANGASLRSSRIPFVPSCPASPPPLIPIDVKLPTIAVT